MTLCGKIATVFLLLGTLGCATIHRHPKAAKITSFIAVGAMGGALAYKYRQPQCHHYEGNQNGVNMACPQERK